MRQLQQGDVLMREVNIDLSDAKEVNRKDGRIVVMHGEGGHTHTISDVDAMFLEKDGKFYLKNSVPVTIDHEEHKPFVIDPGIWEISQVREKDWLSGMVRKVID